MTRQQQALQLIPVGWPWDQETQRPGIQQVFLHEHGTHSQLSGLCFQTKKGKSYLSQRDLNVILLSGQCLEVKCDIKSKARDVFNTAMAYANLVEHFYFGLAYLKGTWPCLVAAQWLMTIGVMLVYTDECEWSLLRSSGGRHFRSSV